MSTPRDKNQPIVDPAEVERHDDQFDRDNPNWDSEHGWGTK